MRHTLTLFITLLLTPLAALHAADAPAQTAGGKPNIILILADDLGVGDIGAYRALYKGGDDESHAWRFTPNLDRLAEQGIRLTRAYACSWCAPSRQMLMSGQWANRTSAYNHPWIGAQLRKAGYVTGMFGKSHGARPTQKVFGDIAPGTAEFDDGLFFNGGARDHYLKPGESLPGRQGLKSVSFQAKGGEQLTDVFTEHAVAFIRRSAEAKQPFLLYLPYTAPHSPLQGKPEDLKKLFSDLFTGLSDSEIRATATQKDQRLRKAHFAALVYGLDRGVGALLQALREAGVEDNTLILFTSDNGSIEGSNYPLTGHKHDLLEGGIRVPFIVWSAAIARSGRAGAVYDGLISLADIAPTVIAQATGQSYAFPTDGINLMPHLLGQKPPPPGRRYFWANSASGTTGMEAFDNPRLGGKIQEAVLVGDDAKILCWHRQGSSGLGTVDARLPNAAGQNDPAALLRERTPISGIFADSPSGKALFQELCRMVNAPEAGLLPEWSGEAPKEASWWLTASGTAVSKPTADAEPRKRKRARRTK